MNKILNWTLGSFFRTLGRVLVYLFVGYILFNFLNLSNIKIPNLFSVLEVHAETFTQENRFTYYLYRNSDTPLESGTGLLDSYGGSGFNRVQFLYNLYTFDSKYLYDITFTTYFSGSGGTGVLTANNWANTCSIYTGTGSQYNCSYTGGFDGNTAYMRGSINNMVGTDVSTLWLNFYASSVRAVNFIQNSYELEINRKENKNVTSENLQNATDSIINNQNNNANNIINNQNNNSQNEINNNNQQQGWNRENATNNANNIINNQNSNTDRTIESQKVCSKYTLNKNDIVLTGYLQEDGYINTTNNTWGVTDYKEIFSYVKKINTYGNLPSICFYDSSKTLISCIKNSSTNIGNLTIPTNSKYFRASINITEDKPQYEYEVCKNGNQAIGDSINDLGDKLTDSTPPANLGNLNNSAGWLPAGPVDSILNLPLSFLNNLNTNLSKSCQPVNLPLPFVDKILPLPCVNTLYNEIDGLPNWINIIGTIASAFILFGYFINLYKYVDDTLTFRENNYIDNWSGV